LDQEPTTTRNVDEDVFAVSPFGKPPDAWSVIVTVQREEPTVSGLVSWNSTS
jgi:hypothetical protein